MVDFNTLKAERYSYKSEKAMQHSKSTLLLVSSVALIIVGIALTVWCNVTYNKINSWSIVDATFDSVEELKGLDEMYRGKYIGELNGEAITFYTKATENKNEAYAEKRDISC